MRPRRFDGLTVMVLATLQAVWHDDGDVTAFEGTVVNITIQRLAESQRRSMERRFRRLVDSAAVGTLTGSLRRGTIEEANQHLIDLFGLRPSELPVALDKLIPDDQRPLHCAVRAALEIDGATGAVATDYVHSDGRRIPVLLSAAIVEPQQGEFIAVVIDRSAEAAAVRRAAQVQAFYEVLLGEPALPVASFDREQSLTEGDHALCEWLGVASPPYGRTAEDLFGSARRAPVTVAAARTLGGATVHRDIDVERSGGHCRTLSFVPRCSESGAVTGFRVIVRACAAAAFATGRAADDCTAGRRSA